MNEVIPVLVLVAATVYWLRVYYQRLWRHAWEAGGVVELEDGHAWLDALTDTDVAELALRPPTAQPFRASRRGQTAMDVARVAWDRRRAIAAGDKEGDIR